MRQRFAGDRRNFDPNSYVGALGRFFRPVSAEFDGTHTVIEYVPVPMEEMPERYGHLIDSALDRRDIAQLFGAPNV